MASTLCCTLKGAAKVALSSSHQAKRDPVTIDHIIALHCSLDLTDAFDIVVFTLACIAFCLLKKQVEAAIEKLTRTVTGPGATDAARKRLEVAYVSRPKKNSTKLCAE